MHARWALLVALQSCYHCWVAAAAKARAQQRPADYLGFIRGFGIRHRLRICNAYPFGATINVRRGKEDMTGSDALVYKDCRDFHTPLKAGDRLDFLVGDMMVGTFAISSLPNTNAVLFLVIYRHDTLSTAVSFQSHVFANLINPQVAVIDTYQGSSESTPRIMDAESAASGASRSEDLRYSSAVAVNPGIYQVALVDRKGNEHVKTELVALNRESYVVLRTGVDAERGPSYSEELVVYPKSSVLGLIRNGSAKYLPLTALAMVVFSTFADALRPSLL